MFRFDRQKLIGFGAGILVVILAAYWFAHSNTPPPQRSTHRIAAGGFEPVIVSRTRSGFRSHRSPYRLEFESSAGAVEVCVVPVSLGYRAVDREHIDKLTDEFAAGQAPQDAVAQSSSKRGKFTLRAWWQGWLQRDSPGAGYLVLIRSANESEVTLVVHYGP